VEEPFERDCRATVSATAATGWLVGREQHRDTPTAEPPASRAVLSHPMSQKDSAAGGAEGEAGSTKSTNGVDGLLRSGVDCPSTSGGDPGMLGMDSGAAAALPGSNASAVPCGDELDSGRMLIIGWTWL
jgi:hypothetical protein